MAARFKAVRGKRGHALLVIGAVEAEIVRQLLTELLELIGAEEPVEEDPLAAALGIGTATRAPDDPVLARLFPDGYTDDTEASADFRRYTERGLRERKRSNASACIAVLPPGGGKIPLDAAGVAAWLGALNDLRLALAERLGIDEEWDHDVDRFEEEDPRRWLYAVYDLLTWMQESLVQVLP